MLDRKMKLCYDIPCVSQACVAQLDRASGYGPEGRGFESCRTQKKTMKKFIVFFLILNEYRSRSVRYLVFTRTMFQLPFGIALQ